MELQKDGVSVLILLAVASGCVREESKQSDFPLPAGPYLGQTLPGNEPALFAPGVVNTGLYTRDVAMISSMTARPTSIHPSPATDLFISPEICPME